MIKKTYVPLTRNPLETVNSQFNKNLRSILKGRDVLISRFSARMTTLPYLYGLIKTHKENNPIRPIISTVGLLLINYQNI